MFDHPKDEGLFVSENDRRRDPEGPRVSERAGPLALLRKTVVLNECCAMILYGSFD
jgi:hypothetical protein